MATIDCFVITATDRCRRWLRRYTVRSADPCPGPLGFHNAQVPWPDAEVIPSRVGNRTVYAIPEDDALPEDDPRWPTACTACGYAFQEDDSRQMAGEVIYLLPDGGETTISEAAVGAMWRAPWLEDGPGWVGPDGQCWVLKTPGGEWVIDGPSTDGTGWTRTGTPPRLTARPSIGMHSPAGGWSYHGWLRDGQLVDA